MAFAAVLLICRTVLAERGMNADLAKWSKLEWHEAAKELRRRMLEDISLEPIRTLRRTSSPDALQLNEIRSVPSIPFFIRCGGGRAQQRPDCVLGNVCASSSQLNEILHASVPSTCSVQGGCASQSTQ